MLNYPCFFIRSFKCVICIFVFILFSIVSNAQAPGITWAKTYGGKSGDFSYWMQRVTDKQYILSGVITSMVVDVMVFNGGFDMWVISLKDSNIAWEKALGGTGDDYAYSVAVTTDSGYIIAGSTTSNDGDVSGNHGGED